MKILAWQPTYCSRPTIRCATFRSRQSNMEPPGITYVWLTENTVPSCHLTSIAANLHHRTFITFPVPSLFSFCVTKSFIFFAKNSLISPVYCSSLRFFLILAPLLFVLPAFCLSLRISSIPYIFSCIFPSRHPVSCVSSIFPESSLSPLRVSESHAPLLCNFHLTSQNPHW